MAARQQALVGVGHPPFWSTWTTDGRDALKLPERFLASGLRCSGRYCDDVGLLAVESPFATASSWWTESFSEEGTNYRVCDNDGFVTGLHCEGRYCDDLSLRCSQLAGGKRSDCYWTSTISEESSGDFVAPAGTFVAGVSCNGRYCDNLNLLLCRLTPAPSHDLAALAATFAPRLRFDQETTTGSGQSQKCFPGDAGAYFDARGQGVPAQDLCNKDYGLIKAHQIPVYYRAETVGDNAVAIQYWFFYAWQSTCFGPWGDHAADWESMAVLIIDGQLERVSYSQHNGHYSREARDVEMVGSHPVGYVGKNSHGTYHDDGGSGGCLYFEDYRNPGGNDYHMDTWENLVPLGRGGDRPAWMNCQGGGCFDGIGHPLDRGDARGMDGCNADGCDRSSLGGNMPFIDDTTGREYSTIGVEHSGRALDVPGAGQQDGIQLTQYSNWHVDNQRWLLEATDAGDFTLRARHSGKCMDVSGASTDNGAPILQWGCHGDDNQRFRLLEYGDGRFAVQNVHSSQCLDIAGASTADGGALIQWPCHWGANQQFRFAP